MAITKRDGKNLQAMVRAIRREPGITLDELRTVTGWKGTQLNRYLVVLETVGFCVRQRQFDRHNQKWVVCVRYTGGK